MFLPLRYDRETTLATYRDENETQESKSPRNGGREKKTCGIEDHPQRRHDQAKQESIGTHYSGIAKYLEDLENTCNGGLGIETIKSSKAPETSARQPKMTTWKPPATVGQVRETRSWRTPITVGQSNENLPIQETLSGDFKRFLQNNRGLDFRWKNLKLLTTRNHSTYSIQDSRKHFNLHKLKSKYETKKRTH